MNFSNILLVFATYKKQKNLLKYERTNRIRKIVGAKFKFWPHPATNISKLRQRIIEKYSFVIKKTELIGSSSCMEKLESSLSMSPKTTIKVNKSKDIP